MFVGFEKRQPQKKYQVQDLWEIALVEFFMVHAERSREEKWRTGIITVAQGRMTGITHLKKCGNWKPGALWLSKNSCWCIGSSTCAFKPLARSRVRVDALENFLFNNIGRGSGDDVCWKWFIPVDFRGLTKARFQSVCKQEQQWYCSF